MKFIVEDKVKDLGVKILAIEINDINNKEYSQEFLNWRSSEVEGLLDKYKEYDLKNDPVIEGFYELHNKVGVPRRKNLPASETLIKLLVKRGDIPHINMAVDIYNLISIESKLCLGAHDILKVSGDVKLKITDGSEKFIPLGSDELKKVGVGEYSFVDSDNDVICWLDIKQVDKTKVDCDSSNIIYFVIGNSYTPDEELEDVCSKIINTTIKYCGGSGKIISK